MPRTRHFVLPLLAILSAAAFSSRADIAYDALTPNSSNQWVGFGSVEVAEDTTLDPSRGLTISGATLSLRIGSITNAVDGTARFSIYQNDAPGRPGAILATAIVPLHMETMTVLDLFIDLPDITLSSDTCWTSYRIVSNTQPAIYPSAAHGAKPIIGATGLGYAFRSWTGDTGGQWTTTGGFNGIAWQIHTVPAPGAASALVLAAAAFAASRRR